MALQPCQRDLVCPYCRANGLLDYTVDGCAIRFVNLTSQFVLINADQRSQINCARCNTVILDPLEKLRDLTRVVVV